MAVKINTNSKQNIAIVFSGLIRNLKYTHENLKSHIFKPITNAGWTYDVYCHNFVLDEPYTSERNKEQPIQLDTEQYKLLNPKYYILDNEAKIADMIDLPAYRTKGNPWPKTSPNYKSLNNYILLQWSRAQITRLLEKNISTGIESYDQVWFIRSDVLFMKPIDPIKYLAKLQQSTDDNNDNTCIIPDFHHWRGYNDRFFIAKPPLAIKYGTYFDQLLELSKTYKLHSESINKLLLKKYNATVHLEPTIKFQRIRTNGEIDTRDINLLTS